MSILWLTQNVSLYVLCQRITEFFYCGIKYTLECGFVKVLIPSETQHVAPGFKNKTRYKPYVSPVSQISHIAISKGNINRQCSIYNILSIKNITLDSK